MDTERDKDIIVQKIRDALSVLPSLQIAYVYGSFLSRNDFRDIDIALLLDGRPGGNFIQKYAADAADRLEESLDFQYEFDVRILNDLPVWLCFEIIRKGMPLYVQNEDNRIDFETQVLVEYQDMKFMYDLFDREYLAQV